MQQRPSDTGSRLDGAPGPVRSRGAFGVDLGHEPPLDPSGSDAEAVDRREVNRRWLGACVLTGVAGGALISASIYIAIEGATVEPEWPERVLVSASRIVATEEREATGPRKGDKLVRQEMVASAKQGFRAPMTLRNGDREVIKVRQFVRVATNLSLTTGTYATDIPPFNPLRLMAEDNGERFVEPTPEANDADVSVVKRELAPLAIEPNAPALSDDDVVAQIEEERRIAGEAGRAAAVPLGAQLMLSRTLRQGDRPDGSGFGLGKDPFSTIDVRVVPENVSMLPKTETRGGDTFIDEHDVALKKGETLEMALRAQGANPDQIPAILAALGTRVKTATLPEGQRMRILTAPHPRPTDPKQVVRVILFGERGIEGIAAMNDRNGFVSVTPPSESVQTRPAANPDDEEDTGDEEGGVRLYESLFETAGKNDIPRQTVQDLVRIFSYDVDFQRRVSTGDTIELFYSTDEDGGAAEVLYAALTVAGEVHRVYRYQGDDGTVDYFDEAGRSLKKFLLRKPIAEGILRSGFGSRRHPILGYSKMHTGVDWANKIGTPIIAAGNGTVIKADWVSGYGRRIEIQHANGYVTSYNHQSRFAAGIAPGVRVRQGQVIGYLGNTGLSTGPHLHYEVIVNGRFVDPMKIRLPRGRELDGRALAEFKRQREQTDGLLERASTSTWMAQRADAR